jgi:hypothetical protein
MIRNFLAELSRTGFNLVDIGSSGSLDSKWEPIGRLINLVGFDPNSEECVRQNNLTSKYKTSTFLPYAVHGHDGIETLYKTKSIYCYSLLEPNAKWLNRFAFRELFEVEGRSPISVRAIDKIEELYQFSPDIIKIDVQGLELPILSKADCLLSDAFYVETETGFTENYIGETTFSQIDKFMREKGFLMFDVNVDHRISRDNLFKSYPAGGEQILWAESVWLKDYIGLEERGVLDLSKITKHKAMKILVLCALQKCPDYGLELAEFFYNRKIISIEEIQELRNPQAWNIAESKPIQSNSSHELSNRVRFLGSVINLLPSRLKIAIKKASSLNIF